MGAVLGDSVVAARANPFKSKNKGIVEKSPRVRVFGPIGPINRAKRGIVGLNGGYGTVTWGIGTWGGRRVEEGWVE